MAPGGGSDSFREELRLFLESVCCDLCRFEHVATEHIAPEDVVIRQEVAVGPSTFADIQVTPKGTAPYFVEIDYGYTPERLIESLRRKYGERNDATAAASKVVLVIDVNGRQDWPGLEARARSVLRPSLALEVWDEHRLDELVRRRFGVSLGSLEEHDRLELRAAVDRAKGRHAFGDDFSADALESTLLWHFGFWRLRQLREAGRKTARDILPPGLYPNAVIVTADLSGYTRFVRDTRHDDVVRRSLTAFASRTRYQIINAGGMLYQFLGDSVIAIFGIPEAAPDDAERGFTCATALIDIGASVAIEWQRQIDQEDVGIFTIDMIELIGRQPAAATEAACRSMGRNSSGRTPRRLGTTTGWPAAGQDRAASVGGNAWDIQFIGSRASRWSGPTESASPLPMVWFARST